MKNEIIVYSQQLGQILKSANLRVTTAESCTGGGIAQAITAVPGSSAWFEAAHVVYSNRMKSKQLNVAQSLLDEFGAVSTQVAEAMLKGALFSSEADIGVAVSGIAGPDGGSAEKPVGTVCIAHGSLNDIRSITYLFSGDRSEVRQSTVKESLVLLAQFARSAVN